MLLLLQHEYHVTPLHVFWQLKPLQCKLLLEHCVLQEPDGLPPQVAVTGGGGGAGSGGGGREMPPPPSLPLEVQLPVASASVLQ